ncbi:hypothetical protein FH972_027213 [Carpinus fangiana]|uniref:PGG domain-containing protein n=1 Tax=Carpinus fangiana TaxID=176857 RepID=A0A5N6L6I6_9ROSI|nr:hypothetical protein FH972_027213 [Carpinus fangiana]
MGSPGHSNDQNKEVRKWSSFFLNFVIPTRMPFPLHEVIPNDMRGVILVAVALIAAVTFQAGVAPPGGVWQDDSNGHVPGRAIYSSQPLPFCFFLICNTLAFSSSIYLLLYLTFGNPFFLEVLVATLSMSGTYAAAVFSVTPYETGPFRLIALVAILPLLIRPVIYFLSGVIRKNCCKGCIEDPMEINRSCPICKICENHTPRDPATMSTTSPD